MVQIGRTAEIARIRSYLRDGSAGPNVLVAISELEQELAAGNCHVADLLDRAKAIVTMAGSIDNVSAAPVVATLIDIAFDAGADEFGLHVVEALLPNSDTTVANEAQIAVQSIVSVWRGITEGVAVALPQAEAALVRSSEFSSPTTQALCLASYGTLLLLSGRIADAQSRFAAALDLAAATGDLRRQLCIYNNNGVALLESGDFERSRQSFERVLTNPNVHSRIRGYGNLAILHYEARDLANATRAAEAVITMNATYKSSALDILGHSILGLACLDAGDERSAQQHGVTVRQLIEHNVRRSSDAGYPTILLGRLHVLRHCTSDALNLIDGAVERARTRDVPCALRLMCEKATIMANVDADLAYGVARKVAMQASEMGAALIYQRASQVLAKVARG